MCPPTLPVELLAHIVAYTARTPHFDFLSSDWAEHLQTRTLHALCLTSLALNELATPHLYGHVTLPTAAAARGFVRTLRSERWQSGERAGKADKSVEAVSIGQEGQEGDPVSGSVVCEVLAELRGARVERVALSGVELGVQAFADMQRKCAGSVCR